MPTNDLSPAAEALLVEERQRFEAWIEGPPYERDTSRYSGSDEQTAWPGQYVDLAVQLAWEAWQKAGRGLGAPRWTACAEGLPEEGVEVLVWDGQRRLIDERENLPHGWRWRDNWDAADEVTHWTELPPPPVP